MANRAPIAKKDTSAIERAVRRVERTARELCVFCSKRRRNTGEERKRDIRSWRLVYVRKSEEKKPCGGSMLDKGKNYFLEPLIEPRENVAFNDGKVMLWRSHAAKLFFFLRIAWYLAVYEK